MHRIIRLCYRKIIDANSRKPWDVAVFDATHLEFYMQAQRMDRDGKFTTFQEFSADKQQAEQLQYLTSAGAMGYIQQLNDIIPDIANTYGKLCLPFKNFKFEIIQSHIEDKSQHRIAIWFYSEPLTWIDTVGSQLLIAYGDHSETFRSEAEVETEMIELVPYLSISHINPAGMPS
jgi:hypothetical protein